MPTQDVYLKMQLWKKSVRTQVGQNSLHLFLHF